ncbi:MAG: exo-alpha-sialidase [Bacteroidales bacterium]|nr:exo-alpha-sialidase [Bacteroidales bacterium]
MKKTRLIWTLPLLLLLSVQTLSCGSKEIERPPVTEPLMPDKGPEGTAGSVSMAGAVQTVICSAGTGTDLYRIPSVISLSDGTILVFAELRHNSWRDKSYTDVVVRRSTDGGQTWSAAANLTKSINSGDYAYMDPTPVYDPENGNIFLFCTRWNKLDTDVTKNRAFMIVSSDGGLTWNTPSDISDSIILSGMFSAGFGPGHGIVINSEKNKGRLVVITRQSNGSSLYCCSIWSDDHGRSWKTGSTVTGGEAQIAESSPGKLYLNVRRGASRYYSYSTDGGSSWSTLLLDSALPTIEGGCEASVLGAGSDMVFYCGPSGGTATSSHDNRVGLTLFRSAVGALTWSRRQELYSLASGYSDMTLLPDGRLAVVFEAGPEQGFIKAATRPAGWMRLDIIVLPAEVTNYDYWFE